MNGHMVMCFSRKSKNTFYLALVDRTMTRMKWWTSDDPEIAMVFRKQSSAEYSANRLRGAFVVSADDGIEHLKCQAREKSKIKYGMAIRERMIMDNIESSWPEGWDGHKW